MNRLSIERAGPGLALRTVSTLSALLCFSAIAFAQSPATTYPTKAIRIVVPVATGGIADTSSRLIAARLTESWGQPVIVENRAGGGGNIGADVIAKAPPDGYTLVMGFVGPHAVNPSLFMRPAWIAVRSSSVNSSSSTMTSKREQIAPSLAGANRSSKTCARWRSARISRAMVVPFVFPPSYRLLHPPA